MPNPEPAASQEFQYGAESPMPGREKEYADFQASGGAEAAAAQAPYRPPPPIDSERRNKSPGISNNFYDTPTTDFKRPYGTGRAAASAPAPGPGPGPAAGPSMGGGMPYGPGPGFAPGPTPAPAPTMPGSDFGAESPMPGREKEWNANRGTGQTGMSAGGRPPPVDPERRSKSPGIQYNFYDMPQSDFKKPWGT